MSDLENHHRHRPICNPRATILIKLSGLLSTLPNLTTHTATRYRKLKSKCDKFVGFCCFLPGAKITKGIWPHWWERKCGIWLPVLPPLPLTLCVGCWLKWQWRDLSIRRVHLVCVNFSHQGDFLPIPEIASMDWEIFYTFLWSNLSTM